jgi:hypothetical protein
MSHSFVRPIAICVLTDGDRILVSEGHDSVKGHTYHRPLGGTIEFGERGRKIVKRELMEEIQAEVGTSVISARSKISSRSRAKQRTRSSWSIKESSPTNRSPRRMSSKGSRTVGF